MIVANVFRSCLTWNYSNFQPAVSSRRVQKLSKPAHHPHQPPRAFSFFSSTLCVPHQKQWLSAAQPVPPPSNSLHMTLQPLLSSTQTNSASSAPKILPLEFPLHLHAFLPPTAQKMPLNNSINPNIHSPRLSHHHRGCPTISPLPRMVTTDLAAPSARHRTSIWPHCPSQYRLLNSFRG
jgi:hypothetical protein